MKIRGITVGTTMKRPDFKQTDPKKSDYIKNNPVPAITEESEDKIVKVKGGKFVLDDIPGYSLGISMDTSTYIMTVALKDEKGNVVSKGTVDLPLESMVVGGYESEGKIFLELKNGSVVSFSLGDFVGGLAPSIGENGNWFVGKTDTGVKATGADGISPTFTLTSIPDGVAGTRIYLKDVNGLKSFDVKDGKDGTSVTVTSVSESTADGGSNVVTFSDGKKVTIKNGNRGTSGPKGDPYTLNEADKAEMVSAVIEALGGNPIYGYVDENKNIVVQGDLADGVYTVKYEMADGSKVDIGELTLGEAETNYFDISTASLNHRLGSAGTPSAYNGMVTTDFIECDSSMADKVFHIDGITMVISSSYGYSLRAVYYDENKTKIVENNANGIVDYTIAPMLSSMTGYSKWYMRVAMVIKDNVALTEADVANLKITLGARE